MKGLRLAPLVAALLALPAAAYSPAGEARVAADCSVRSTGLIPLTDLGRARYQGQPGGLYPGSANRPPRRYLQRGLTAARQVRPINGRVGVLGVGMSNATLEFRGFMKLATEIGAARPNVRLVDGGGPGWDAARMARQRARYFRHLDARLRRAGVRRSEVQVVWLKQAIAGEDREFPQDARALRGHLRTIVRGLTARFPNLRLVYVSSRTYAGYAITHLNPEPHAYHSGFAAKWLVQDGIARRFGRVWIGWGPYLWTDGMRGRSDGLVWACDDVQQDGTHPSPNGVRKVARLLHDFFTTDPTARIWYTAAP